MSIIEHFKHERDNFVIINDILKCTNFLLTIPCLRERWHFHKLNTLKKVRILISECFKNLSFSHGSTVEHFKQKRKNFITIIDITNYTILLISIASLGERWHFDTLNTLKKVQILISRCVGNFSFTKMSIIEYFKHERDNFVIINDFSKCTNSPM